MSCRTRKPELQAEVASVPCFPAFTSHPEWLADGHQCAERQVGPGLVGQHRGYLVTHRQRAQPSGPCQDSAALPIADLHPAWALISGSIFPSCWSSHCTFLPSEHIATGPQEKPLAASTLSCRQPRPPSKAIWTPWGSANSPVSLF